MSVEIIRDVTGIRARVAEFKNNNKTVCLVPTMGGLHAGHLSLIAKAREVADHVVVSIFVNPKQFNNPDDLKTYPSNEEDDVKSIAKEGILKGRRNHVHLSIDKETAIKVGSRHGKPFVLKINAELMSKQNIPFYFSDNKVWLTEYVGPDFIENF